MFDRNNPEARIKQIRASAPITKGDNTTGTTSTKQTHPHSRRRGVFSRVRAGSSSKFVFSGGELKYFRSELANWVFIDRTGARLLFLVRRAER